MFATAPVGFHCHRHFLDYVLHAMHQFGAMHQVGSRDLDERSDLPGFQVGELSR